MYFQFYSTNNGTQHYGKSEKIDLYLDMGKKPDQEFNTAAILLWIGAILVVICLVVAMYFSVQRCGDNNVKPLTVKTRAAVGPRVESDVRVTEMDGEVGMERV
jgi:hypothetical protein